MNSPKTDSVFGNILIVDDKPENLRLLSTMLSEQGYEVRCVISGSMALMGANANPPDLILLDINMPQMNGYELCEHLKTQEETREIPVIFISALDDVLDKVKAFAVGGVDYITKPFQVEEVLARVQNQLSLRKLQIQEQEKSELLAKALQDLQRTQTQLIQSEKMSALGHLVAGIAHEINNPINFISGNLRYASEHIKSLLDLIQLYQNNSPNSTQEIEQKIESIDLEFVKSDLPKLLTSMQLGAKRIAEIVQSLRNFSRLDEAELKKVDIHEGIDSTLMILQQRLSETLDRCEIEIVKKYSALPLVECYARELNQVFLNILNNAIDSLNLAHQKQELSPPKITICTQLRDAKKVAIAVTDNGVGIASELQQRVFDPFFTTKEVGSGIGLGLAISYSVVVERHGGCFYCSSDPGQGATFTVEIPIQQKQTR